MAYGIKKINRNKKRIERNLEVGKTLMKLAKYIKPEIQKIELDNSISIVMMTWNPGDGKPPGPPGKPPHPPHPNQIFESPFNDKPFN